MAQTNQPNPTILRPPILYLLMLFILLIGSGLGYWLSANQTPAESSVEVGFARDMSDHHRQAVEMATLLYSRTDDEEMRTLAYDILTTQQGQIGIMTGWLDVWGHSVRGEGARMEWMDMSVTGLMPGMATREQLASLENAQGVEADAIFMQLMIPHHISGVEMARAATAAAQTDVVRTLAQNMADAQQFEIDYMQTLLQEKGFDPVPLMDMEMEMEMEMDG